MYYPFKLVAQPVIHGSIVFFFFPHRDIPVFAVPPTNTTMRSPRQSVRRMLQLGGWSIYVLLHRQERHFAGEISPRARILISEY